MVFEGVSLDKKAFEGMPLKEFKELLRPHFARRAEDEQDRLLEQLYDLINPKPKGKPKAK